MSPEAGQASLQPSQAGLPVIVQSWTHWAEQNTAFWATAHSRSHLNTIIISELDSSA